MIDRIADLKSVQDEALALFVRKHRDYGDSFAEHGIVGIIVRIADKLRRAQTITASGVTVLVSESLRDTLLDLHNYAAMGVAMLDALEAEEDPFDDGGGDEPDEPRGSD